MVDEICNVLSGFRQLLRDYHVRVFRAVATSAVREAKNRDYVLDQIQVRTGIGLEVLHNSEERYLTQLAVRHVIPEYAKLKAAGLLTMDIGSGSIQIAAYDDSGLVYNQNIEAWLPSDPAITFFCRREFPSISQSPGGIYH
ncbi:MAG: hypothetical protein ACLR23_01695 [Clostridia bacterium]